MGDGGWIQLGWASESQLILWQQVVWDSILKGHGHLSPKSAWGVEVWGEHRQTWREGAQVGRQRYAWEGAAVSIPLKSVGPWAPSHPRSYLWVLSLDGAFSGAPQGPWGRSRGQIKGQAP